MISRITDRILPEIREWQNRPLKRLYAMVFMDAIHDHVRKERTVVNKAVYIAIGIDMSGAKDVLGLYIGEAETSKFWLNVMNEMKNRGYFNMFSRWIKRLLWGDYKGLSTNNCTTLHCSSNSK